MLKTFCLSVYYFEKQYVSTKVLAQARVCKVVVFFLFFLFFFFFCFFCLWHMGPFTVLFMPYIHIYNAITLKICFIKGSHKYDVCWRDKNKAHRS